MKFQEVEQEARELDNLAVLEACAGKWVRNKDIARVLGMTPAGAKRKSESLEAVGLLQRRRHGKEVQSCSTVLAYIANLDLAASHRLESMGVMRVYLDATKEYSMRVLRELGVSSQEEREYLFRRGRDFLAYEAYLFPVDMLGQLYFCIPGFNRSNTRILEANSLTLPLPRMDPTEYSVLRARMKTMLSKGIDSNKRLAAIDIDAIILRGLLTGEAKLVDYEAQRHAIEETYSESRSKAAEHCTVLQRFRELLSGLGEKGPFLYIIDYKLGSILEHLAQLGLRPVDLPEPMVGLPNFDIFPPYNEDLYTSLVRTHYHILRRLVRSRRSMGILAHTT